MANQLRPIALTVNEPSPGLFHWSLLESSGERSVFNRRVAAAGHGPQPFTKLAHAPRSGAVS